MILAIKRNTITVGQPTWEIFDKIKHISISDSIEEPEPILRSDVINYTNETCLETPPNYIIINCELEDGNKIVIAFDIEAYVCNDEGKTIRVLRP